MPMDAAIHPGILGSRAFATKDVDTMRDRLTVERVHTVTAAAEVV
jgi:hypothetical protein